jgi:hypothetical protein
MIDMDSMSGNNAVPADISEHIQEADLVRQTKQIGRPAIMIDGRMRWLDGSSDGIGGRSFYYTEGPNGTFLLYPKEKFNERGDTYSQMGRNRLHHSSITRSLAASLIYKLTES